MTRPGTGTVAATATGAWASTAGVLRAVSDAVPLLLGLMLGLGFLDTFSASSSFASAQGLANATWTSTISSSISSSNSSSRGRTSRLWAVTDAASAISANSSSNHTGTGIRSSPLGFAPRSHELAGAGATGGSGLSRPSLPLPLVQPHPSDTMQLADVFTPSPEALSLLSRLDCASTGGCGPVSVAESLAPTPAPSPSPSHSPPPPPSGGRGARSEDAGAGAPTLGSRTRLSVRQRVAPLAHVVSGQDSAVVPRRRSVSEDDDDDDDEEEEGENGTERRDGPGKTFKIKKHKLKKWLLPLLIGYKLKFMTLVPLLFATLALLVASAGFAGFFFAMFTAALTLPKAGHH